LAAILGGRYRSSSGMGVGIIGSRRLMDAFDIVSTAETGTTVWLRKVLPRRAPLLVPAAIAPIVDRLAREARQDPLAEVLSQNQELLRTLDELRRRQDELRRLNSELEDTNRGVLALYAELDERADHLRRADDLKSKFLSNMSHEFRTPLNSMLALTRLLMDRVDGPLTPEQERQVGFIRKAATDLSELVNDLLDLAKVEAGKIVIRPTQFTVDRLFGALRGMLRPLLINPALDLVFEDAADVPPVESDESKISQILRNFISNALKFTERGEIRVTASLSEDRQSVVLAVADTGVGIAPEDQELIFQEFTQIDSRMQRRVRGTGLGLPLSRKLAHLLGGTIGVNSTPGLGSTFTLSIPRVYRPAALPAAPAAPAAPVAVEWQVDPARIPVAVVEDSADVVLTYESYLRGTPFQMLSAQTVGEARRLVQLARPRAVILDILLRGEDGWELLLDLKREEETSAIPVIVVTDVDDEQKAYGLGATAYARKPVERAWLLQTLRNLATAESERRVLIIDDDDVARYLLKGLLRDLPCQVSEASGGREGLELARLQRPDVIFCDVFMPEMGGVDVLRELRADPSTRGIPVVMNTVKTLSDEERTELAGSATALLSKEAFARADGAVEVRRALAEAGVAL
ncbi:MAG TPA: response regulator, partial [Gaiellaceae bacterium]|nr:response regulator [Gaiellaceae bacterium]